MTDEKTGKKAATIASRLMKMLQLLPPDRAVYVVDSKNFVKLSTVEDLRTLAGSALTQAPDKKKK